MEGIRPTSAATPTAAGTRTAPVAPAQAPEPTQVDSLEKGTQAAPPPPTPAPPAPPEAPSAAGLLARLKDAGYASIVSPESLEATWASGREALVRFEHPDSNVVSLRNLDELETYSRLAGSSDSDVLGGLQQFLKVPEDQRQAFHHLQDLGQQGNYLYFSRQRDRLAGYLPLPDSKTWLGTDAAGATLLLARGEKVRVLLADGSETQLSSLAQADVLTSPKAPAPRARAAQLLDRLAGLTPRVLARPNMETPADQLSVDYEGSSRAELKSFLTSPFHEETQTSSFLQHKKMLDDLASGGYVQIQPEGAYPFYTGLVNLKQLETLTQYLSRGSDAMLTFNQGVERLSQAGGMLFARQQAGDATGALVKANPLTAYLTMSAGGELVVLDGKGDLTPCHGLDQFLEAVYAKGASPETRAFFDDFRTLEKAGFSFGVPKPESNSYRHGDSVDVARALDGQQLVRLKGPDGQVRTVGRSHIERMAAERRPEAAGAAAKSDLGAVDPAKPKPNLFMVYYNALQDPNGKFSYYDDFPVRLMERGSSDQVDLVLEHSDLPVKHNLRTDYVQPGALQNLEQRDPSQEMSDTKVFEDFVYDNVTKFPDRDHIRLMVVGHGGAEGGTVDDWSQGDRPTVNNMSVDDFAGAISKALDRVEAKTGKRPKIDNLIMGSCLMGNTSLVDALARRGDVRCLSASPEVLLDGFPAEIIDYLKQPENANKSAQDYAKALVDINMKAPGLEGGRTNRPHALIYGAYDLDPNKNAKFRDALGGFFQACLNHPQYASIYREDVQKCPGYNIHPAGGPGIGSKERDLIQVAQTLLHDARIHSGEVKKSAQALIEACQAQVLEEKTIASYAGRQGASISLPLNPYEADVDHEPATELLRSVPYRPFVKLLLSAPDQRTAQDVLTDTSYQEKGQQMMDMVDKIEPFKPAQLATEEQKLIEDLQAPQHRGLLKQIAQALGGSVGAVMGGALGAAAGAVMGVLVGIRAGLTGASLNQSYWGWTPPPSARPHAQTSSPPAQAASPVETDKPQAEAAGPKTQAPQDTGPHSLAAAMDLHPELMRPAILVAPEYLGVMVNKKVAYHCGNSLARVLAVPVGAVGGLVGGLATGLVAGGVIGAQTMESAL